jgi:hypothetical protein
MRYGTPQGLIEPRSKGAVAIVVERIGFSLPVLALARFLPVPTAETGRILDLPTLCPFHRVTGIPCPGCGMLRSLVCAEHGLWHESVVYHPLGIAFLILLAADAVRRLFFPDYRMSPVLAGATAVLGLIALLGVWFLRLAFGAPAHL